MVREGFSEGINRIRTGNTWGNGFVTERTLRANACSGTMLGIQGIARRLHKLRKQIYLENWEEKMVWIIQDSKDHNKHHGLYFMEVMVL